MEDRILDVLKNVLELNSADTTICTKNCEAWDSMAQLNIMVELETEFDVSFEPEEIAEMISYDAIKAMLENKGAK